MFAFIPISSHHRGAPTYRTNDVFTALARQSLGPQSIEGYLFGGAVTRYLGRRTPAHRGVFCDHDHAAQHRHYGFPPFHRADNGLGGMFSGPIPHADETAALFFNEVAQQSERRAREQTRARAAEAAGLRNPEYSETFELLRPLYGEECGKAANNHPGASIGLNPRHQDEDLNEHELLRLVDEEKQQVLALEEEVRRVTSENERAHSVEQLIQEYITNFVRCNRFFDD